MLANNHGGVAAWCRLLDLAESSYYHEGPGHCDVADDLALLRALTVLAGKHPTYGYRRLAVLVRSSESWKEVNAKRVRRILKMAGITARKSRRYLLTTDSSHSFRRYPNLVRDWSVVDHPDQVWVCDITYIILATGEIVYLAIVLDVFTRMICGWELGTDLTHSLVVNALMRALKRRVCEIHHSDQGIQYATPVYTAILTQHGIQISMSDKGSAWQNGYAERWMRTLKEEEVYLTEYQTYQDALKQIGKFIDIVYNKKRIHSALGYLTPVQYEAQWRVEL